MTVAYDGSRFRGFAANRDVRHRRRARWPRRSSGSLGRPVELTLRRAHRRRRARLGSGGQLRRPTPTGSTSAELAPGGQQAVRPRDRGARRRGRPTPTSTPASRRGPSLPLHDAQPARARSVPRRTTAWHVEPPLDLPRAAARLRPAHRRARLLVVLPPPKVRPTSGRPRSCGGCSTPAGTTLGDGVLRFEIEANAFCHQMVRSLVGTLVDVGLGRRRPGEVTGILRAARPPGRRPAGAAPRPVPVGGPLRATELAMAGPGRACGSGTATRLRIGAGGSRSRWTCPDAAAGLPIGGPVRQTAELPNG